MRDESNRIKVEDLLKNAIYKAKELTSFDRLNSKEELGFIGQLAWLKMLHKTSLNVPFSIGRSIRGIAFSDAEKLDTFGKMISNVKNGCPSDQNIDYLLSLYNEEERLSAADVVSLKQNKLLAGFPSWALVLPWENNTLEQQYNRYIDIFKEDRRRNGVIFKNELNFSNMKDMYSRDIAKSQILQTQNLFNGIKERGLIRTNKYPRIIIFIYKNNWRWCMSREGNHRAYICSQLGYKYFKCVIDSVIKRDDASSWFNVRNGTFNVNEAIMLFDKIIEGRTCIRGVI